MSKNQKQWWHTATIYQIYPRSFSDGNADGIGDLYGVLKRIEYVRDLGVDAVWFSPFYPSPGHDAGYDVSDYFNINPEYGDLEVFDQIAKRCHELKLRIIVDLVPNHTSIEHEWFKQVLKDGPESFAAKRYILRKNQNEPPNNWGSIFGGPAWSRLSSISNNPADHDWWYLHLFDSTQPDLNWENPEIRQHFERFLRFWADRGVSGFRVDVANAMIKMPGLPNDKIGPDRFHPTDNIPPDAVDDPYFDQEEIHDIFRSWRRILDEYGPDRMLVAEAWVSPQRAARYVRADEMSQAFNFTFLQCGWDCQKLRSVIDETKSANDAVCAPTTWVLSNHDVVRHATRLGYPYGAQMNLGIGPTDPQPDRSIGLRRARAYTLFMMALPGSAYIYQGEELGLPEHTTMPDHARQDPTWKRTKNQVRGRDGCRVPIPWEYDGTHFGFGAGAEPWLPQPDYWGEFAVDVQTNKDGSTLEMYREMLRLRKLYALGQGQLRWIESEPNVLAFDNGQVRVFLNMGVLPVDIGGQGSEKESEEDYSYEVLLHSGSGMAIDTMSPNIESGHGLVLEPGDGVWILRK